MSDLKAELDKYDVEVQSQFNAQALAYLGNSLGAPSSTTVPLTDLTALDSLVVFLGGLQNVPGKMLLDKTIARQRILKKRVMIRAECVLRAGCEKSLLGDLTASITAELKNKAGVS